MGIGEFARSLAAGAGMALNAVARAGLERRGGDDAMRSATRKGAAVEHAARIETLDLRSGIPGLPFSDGPHPVLRTVAWDNPARMACDADVRWYATQDDVASVRRQMSALDSTVTPSALGSANVPRLRMLAGRVDVPMDGGGEPDRNHCMFLTLTPKTPTGKEPKYPAVVHVRNTPVDGCGCVCKLMYLADGTLGKADVNYLLPGVTYSAAWRVEGGALLPMWIVVRSFDPTDQDITIWRREK